MLILSKLHMQGTEQLSSY